MSYPISFDGLNKDICTLTAWMLVLNSIEYLNSYCTLKENMSEFLPIQIGELLLSIAARLRIIRDKTRSYSSKYQKQTCGQISLIDNRPPRQEFTITSGVQPLDFEDALDKILHATIEVQRSIQISNAIKFIITLSGKGKDKDEWEAELDTLSFCQAALGFINVKKQHYLVGIDA